MNDLILKEKWEELTYLYLNLVQIMDKKGVQSLEVIQAKQILELKINEYCQIKK